CLGNGHDLRPFRPGRYICDVCGEHGLDCPPAGASVEVNEAAVSVAAPAASGQSAGTLYGIRLTIDDANTALALARSHADRLRALQALIGAAEREHERVLRSFVVQSEMWSAA